MILLKVGDTYQIINPDKLGHAVIINNVATEFPGSKKDTEAMVKTYQMIKFEVSLSEDCNDKVRISHYITNFLLLFHLFSLGTIQP